MTDAENVSEERVEAALVAARIAIFGENRKGADFASGPWAIRVVDLAKCMEDYAASRYADGVREGLRMAREIVERMPTVENYYGRIHAGISERDSDIIDAIDARIKEGT